MSNKIHAFLGLLLLTGCGSAEEAQIVSSWEYREPDAGDEAAIGFDEISPVSFRLNRVQMDCYSDGSSSVNIWVKNVELDEVTFQKALTLPGSETAHTLDYDLDRDREIRVRFGVGPCEGVPYFSASIDNNEDFSDNEGTEFTLTEAD